MTRIREIPRCRAWVIVKRDENGVPIEHRQCLSPAIKDGRPDCEHGEIARMWIAKYAP